MQWDLVSGAGFAEIADRLTESAERTGNVTETYRIAGRNAIEKNRLVCRNAVRCIG